MSFRQSLNKLIMKKKSALCVGLDTDPLKIPVHLQKEKDGVVRFNKAIIEATSDMAVAYKINIAFYESRGLDGWKDLENTLQYVNDEVILIADAKRGDIGNTSRQYAKTFFETLQFDAITVAPYMGEDSIRPFLEYTDKGVFILCLTSNAGSSDFQYLESGGKPLYHHVAEKIKSWNAHDNVGLVAGATHPTELKTLREISGPIPYLIPGIGAQGGDLEAVMNFTWIPGEGGILVNSSRGIIYAADDESFAAIAREKAMILVQEMRQYMGEN